MMRVLIHNGRSNIPIIVTALFLGGCTSPRILLDAVGPAPGSRSDSALQGSLMVYTVREWQLVHDGPSYYPHTGYEIFQQDGKHFATVPNRSTEEDADPQLVLLPPGQYAVHAEAKSGRVSLPIIVMPNRRTEVHLDGMWQPNYSPKNAADFVQLPDGQIVGWRAPSSR